MDNSIVLLLIGFVIGTVGTLIGAGGGFFLVPLLIFTHPSLSPEKITAISIVIVACNAISGSVAYARSGRIDFKAGMLFALFTIPGSILGVYITRYIPAHVFSIAFGIILILLSLFLFIKKNEPETIDNEQSHDSRLTHQTLTDKTNTVFRYAYNKYVGIAISIIVGFLSPLLGIGGGIIHVPAMVSWLKFPVYIATATSHFILAVMATVSVIVHALKGNYAEPYIQHMIVWLSIGAIAGAQLGAFFSHKINTNTIVKALAVCLGLVGLRLLTGLL
ncbi:MAG: sulfite exporter TauE/SafE family protein [Agriterribacter sp.]